jgi:methylmalonyl-CoA/ethylmalonyl-CoA epimerase
MKPIGTNSVVKIIHVVRSIEATLDGFVEVFGIERPQVVKGGAEDRAKTGGKFFTVFRGRDIAAPVLLANVQMGPILIEVIQPLDPATPWGEFLARKGEGIYSVVFTVEDFHGKMAGFAEAGMPNFHLGEWDGGRYGYFDTIAKLGFALGLQEFDKG